MRGKVNLRISGVAFYQEILFFQQILWIKPHFKFCSVLIKNAIKKSWWQQSSTLPAFINEIYHQCTEDKENEQGDKHVVDGTDVVHLKQLTAKGKKRKEKSLKRTW